MSMTHIEIPDFIDAYETSILYYAAVALSGSRKGAGIWDNRITFYDQIAAYSPLVAGVMRDTQRRVMAEIKSTYGAGEIYTDTAHFARWPVGVSMPPHRDNSHADGSQHDVPWREYASVIYLNDGFEGGEFRFTESGLTIKPQAGLLVAFPADYLHEVFPCEGCERITMPAFYTSDFDKRDRGFYGE